MLTDSNRRRNTSFFASIRDTKSATLRAGEDATSADGYDRRVDLFDRTSDATRSVVETHGGRVDTSNDGGVDRPEDRGTRAFDGDTTTAWRVGGPDPIGSWIRIRPDRAVRTDHVDLVQPLGLPRDRWITGVDVTVNGGAPRHVTLGDASFTPAGQRVTFPETAVRSLRIDITDLHQPPFDPRLANAVGFAEIRLGDDPHPVGETVRLPEDLARRVGSRADGHALAVVLTRLRQETATDGRQDEEAALDRRFLLPDGRSFALSGTARLNPNAPGPALDTLLGTAAPGLHYDASSHLVGDLDARASRAFTGVPGDAWTSAIGPPNQQWVQITGDEPITTDHITFSVRADADHSFPTAISVRADDTNLATLPLSVAPDVALGATPTEVPVTISFPTTSAHQFALVVEDARVAVPVPPAPVAFPPVSISDVTIPGVAPVPHTAPLPTDCSGSVHIDGHPVPFRLAGDPADASRGLGIEPCAGPVTLARGSHRVTSPPGAGTGLDVDRVVLTSNAAGAASTPGAFGALRTAPGGARGHQLPHRDDGADPQRREAVLARAGSESQRRVGGKGRRPVTRRAEARRRLRERLARPPAPRRTGHGAAVLDATAHDLDRARGLRGRARPVPRAPVRRPASAASPTRCGNRCGARLGVGPAGAVDVDPARSRAPSGRDRRGRRRVLPRRRVREPVVDRTRRGAGGARRRARAARVRPLLGLAAAVVLVAARTGHHPGLAWDALALFAVTVLVSVLGGDRGAARDPVPGTPDVSPPDVSPPDVSPPGDGSSGVDAAV